MRIVILAAALALTGCAPKLSMMNEAGGVVDQTGSAGNDRAFELATQHCAKYDKVPKITKKTDFPHRLRFDCVAK